MYIYMSSSPDPHQPFLPPAIGDAIRTPSPSVINPSSISPSICTWGGLGGPGGAFAFKGSLGTKWRCGPEEMLPSVLQRTRFPKFRQWGVYMDC